MGPIGKILPTRNELAAIIAFVGIAGWAVIEFILWLFSFVTITIN